ncbi:oocyte zinc finger protein XlCOF6-like isoform X2 [Hetaerina americana]
MCIRSASELKRKRLTVTIKQERESDEEEVITDDFTSVNRGGVPKADATVRAPDQTKQDWRMAGADGRVQRPSQIIPPVEVFVKVGEDCGLPLKNDGLPVERDPLSMSEEAIPSTLITMSDDRVFREERFSESSPAARNPIILQRVIKQEVDDDALETTPLSVADTSAQKGSTDAMVGEGGDAGCTVHGRREALRRGISGGEKECSPDKHRDRSLSDAALQGRQSFNLHSNQKKMQLRFGRRPSTVGIGGNTAAVGTNSVNERCVGNGDSEGVGEDKGEGTGVCGISSGWTGGHVVSLCDRRGNASLLESVEVVMGAEVNSTREDNVGDLGDSSARRNERKAMSDEVKEFKCDVCGDEFDTKESIQKHVRLHSVEVFNCGLCFVGFICKEEYERHRLGQHGIGPDEDEPLDKVNSPIARDDGDQFDSGIAAIGSGTRTDGDTDERSRTCNVCHKTFSRKSYLKCHIAVHSKEKPYSCSVCDKTFITKGNLNAHMTSVHSDSKRHACSICLKSFARRDILRAHMVLHTGANPHSCTVCTKSFTTDTILKAHMVLHTGVSPHVCTVCSKVFTTDNNLKTHMYTHTGVRPHVCSVCTKSFPTKSLLKLHILAHVEKKPYSCDVCGRAFTRKYILKRHTALHSGDRPFSCTICGKTFVTMAILKTHLTVHAGGKPYSCTSCPKTFSTKGNLKSHLLVHSGEKPHQCGICSRSFPTKGNLNVHMTVHSRERSFSCGICSKTFTLKGNLKKHLKLHKT